MIDKRNLIKVFILYFVLLMWVILFRMNVADFCGKYNGIVFKPFSDEFNYTSDFARKVCIIGNILTFIPMGIYLCLFFKNRRFYKRVGFGLCFSLLASLFLEIIQYIFVIGISSMTDLIHNLIGGLIGICIYESLKFFVSDKVINNINKYTFFILIPIVAFALINTVINMNLYI